MLQIQHICKEYKTGKLVQKALDDFSLNLRDNEFVAVLGPSGSGKTTFLNIIGGLDRYDSGELIINGISTKEYKDREWDSYRNHTIGFVFQNYNLIPHQTLLSNVELALTISGVGKKERRKRALEALDKVGLKEHAYKLPNQISGGQMQRVAIARALVNDPDIVLADEPTGALDSVTSLQVMDLLKEVAKDRLVVMVTHNPELARQYATRIVEIRDGRMVSDSDPYEIDEQDEQDISYDDMGKSSMSLMTAVSLSFNNLLTKKGRTILTAFAGSIGIIGIALIMSISAGVNNYIADIEEETLTGYPLQITSSGLDINSLMERAADVSMDVSSDTEKAEQDDEINTVNVITAVLSRVESNDLASLKEYFDSGSSGIEPYVNAIEYSYDIDPQIYLEYEDGSYRQVHPDSSFSLLGLGSESSSSSMFSSFMSTDVFHELPSNAQLYENEYDIKVGRWPEDYNELVLVLSSRGTISDFMLYSLGLRNGSELDTMVREFADSEDIDTPDDIGNYLYDEVLGLTFRLICAADYYEYDDIYGVWKDKTDNADYMKELIADAEELTIVGVVQPKAGAVVSMLSSGLYFHPSLIEHVADLAKDSEIAKDQLAHPDINIFTGEKFGEESSDNSFDLSNLFDLDLDSLYGMFDIDIGSLDIVVPPVDWNGILEGITFDIEIPDMTGLISDAFSDYYEYMLSEEGRADLEQIRDQLADETEGDVSQDEASVTGGMSSDELFRVLMRYAGPGGIDFTGFMQSKEVEQILGEWMEQNGYDGSVADTDAINEILNERLSSYTDDYASVYSEVLQNILIQALGEQSSAIVSSIYDSVQEQITAAVSDAALSITSQISSQVSSLLTDAVKTMIYQMEARLSNSLARGEDIFSGSDEDSVFNMSSDDLVELIVSMNSGADATYKGNLASLGYVDFDTPYEISVYPIDFAGKEAVTDILDAYNERMEEEGNDDKIITYTDIVGTLMSSVTDIIDMISYVLIAFVSISLIVSSIMIGVITYISVLERRKEIGILRSLGASKGNISWIFIAETGLIGLCSGILGVAIALFLHIPGDALIHYLAGNGRVNLYLAPFYCIALVALSIALTLFGGLIPARKAADSDPVTALRTE